LTIIRRITYNKTNILNQKIGEHNMFLTNSPKPLDNVFLEIGPLTIMWYAVLILTGAMTALVLAVYEGKKIGVERPFLEDLVLFGIPIAVIGARFFYVLFEWGNYKNNLIDIFKINEGGLAIYGAVFFALPWGYYLSKKRHVNFLKVIDLGAPGFLIAQAIGRWGNFMNQEAHGGEVTRQFLENLKLPRFIIDQMYINGTYYHPTFLYESIWNIIGFVIILFLRRTKLLFVGDLGLIYMIWYGIGRYLVEGMRTDSLYIGNTGLRVSQVISIVAVVAGIIVLILRHTLKWKPKYYFEVIQENEVEHAA
jgi:phosphatidylglycerol---prolipoprotein diacylglyceryl transferase